MGKDVLVTAVDLGGDDPVAGEEDLVGESDLASEQEFPGQDVAGQDPDVEVAHDHV